MEKTNRMGHGITWNWLALGFSYVVNFFLSPFILHQLGMLAYGVWAVAVSVTSYMSLLDLGLRGAVTRFVSKYHAEKDHAKSSQIVSAALWLRQWVALAIILLSLLISTRVNRFFSIPGGLHFAATWAIILTGTSLAITLVFGVFGGVLAALHRFDLLSRAAMLQTTIRAAGVVWLLKSGKGILALAVWELVAAVISSLVLLAFCFRAYPELRPSLGIPGKNVLRDFWGYSSYLFFMHIFGQVIFYTDNIVVGRFVSVSAVTFFAIGGSLSEYLRQVIASVTTTFMPLASRFEAAGQRDNLRRLLAQGTRFALLAAFPILVALFFRGETFIRLWMGAQYAPVSERVLQILLVAQVFAIANSTSINLILGLAKHRQCTIWNGFEAAANLLLSIWLARRIGLYGVALGTAIPSLFVHLLLWPRYVCKIVGVPLRQHLFQNWARPAFTAIPFAVACILTDRYWVPQGLFQFFLQIGAILPLYVFAAVLGFWKEIVWQLRSKTKWLSRPAAAPGAR